MRSEFQETIASSLTSEAEGQPISVAHRIKQRVSMLARLWRGHFLALADQGVVSATSFMTTVIISRYSDAAQLGAYAIGISFLASMYTIQGQLISLPYSIHRCRKIGTEAEHAGGALVLAGLLASLATLLLALVAAGLLTGGAQTELTAITWALVGVMPFALLRDFFRRFAFTHLHMGRALILDSTVAILQLSLLAWLGWAGHMSAVTASLALGASCGIVALGCLSLSRVRFAFRTSQLPATMKQSWTLGKWLVVKQMMVQVQRFSPYWLLVIISGATSTGIYTACMSIVAFTNPLFFGLNNLFTQKSVLAWRHGGGDAVRLRAFKDFALLAAALGPICLLILWFGEDVMQILYRGHEYAGYGHVIAMLAFATLAFALGTPAGNALASMERPRVVFVINALGAVLTALVVWRSLVTWGLPGAAFGCLLSNTIVSLGLWVGLLRAIAQTPDHTPAREVLGQVVGWNNSHRWAISYLGEGDYSTVYIARSIDGHPIWRTHNALVLKVYKPEAGLTIDMVYVQFSSLLRLYATINGSDVNGWTISIPMPLQVCQAPLALVMTAISGKDLKSNTATDNDLTTDVLRSLGETMVRGMRQSWSHGQMHGDLGLQNILYDVKAQQLTLIDPGTPECCVVCMQMERRWKPEVLELGHILRDLGTDIRDFTGHPGARLRRKVFTENALRALIEALPSAKEKRRVLNEIFDCAQEHLVKVIQASWPLRMLFARPLMRFVSRRMKAVLADLEEALTSTAQATELADAVLLQPTLSSLAQESQQVCMSAESPADQARTYEQSVTTE